METNHYQIFFRIFFVLVPLLFAPLAIGVINKTKAFFAGRKGVRVLQLYYDIFKLLKKEHVYSESSNFILRMAPLTSLALTVIAMFFLPLGAYSSPFAFAGDIDISRFEIIFKVNCYLAFRQVTDMTHRGDNIVIFT